MNNETEVSIKFSNTINGNKQLADYEKRLQNIYSYISSINSGQTSAIRSVKNATKDLGNEVKTTENKINKMGVSFKGAFNTLGIIATIKASTRLVKSFAQLVNQSSKYIENLNLLQVAYADIDEKTNKFNRGIEETSDEIQNFIDKMADVYGLDESNLTRQFGIFRQMANAMKLPYETASDLSELMVKMTNDIASLYNLDLSRASNALQSALAGQVRPIRSATGADITEKTLQSTVDALGLDRSISQLSYVEKRLIMVISLTDQLKKSQGDYGRTIDSVANQVRVMHEQWDRLSRSVGNVFYPILERVLPYLNAVLMVLVEIFNLIASLMGFKLPEFDYSGLTGASDATLDIIDGMDEAGASVDNLKDKLKGLRGFDKLNVINSPTSSSSSASAGAGIDPAIMDAFNDKFNNYNDMLDEVNMKATQIRDAILDWLGFTDGTYKNLKLIAIVLGTIMGLKILKGISGLITGTSTLGKILGTGGLYKTLTNLVAKFKDFNLLGKILSPTGLIIGGVLALASAFIYAYKTNDEFKEKVNKLVKTLISSLKPILDVLITLFSKIGETIMEIVKILFETLTPILEIVIDILQFLIEKVVTPLIKTLSNILIPIINAIAWTFEEILLPAIETISNAFTWLLNGVIKPLWDGISYFIEHYLKGLIDFITGTFSGDWSKAWEGIKNIFDGVINGLWGTFKSVFDKIGEKITTTTNQFKELWGYLSTNEKTGKTGLAGAWENWKGGMQLIFSSLFKANGGVLVNGKWNDITTYATGGMPSVGQMFVAREAGAELVGQIGGHTAVMNNDQIVSSVSDGVYRAMVSANKTQSQSTQVYNIYLDEAHKLGTYTLQQLQDMAKTNGKPITIG